MENEVRLNIKITAELLNRVKLAAKEKQLTATDNIMPCKHQLKRGHSQCQYAIELLI